RLQPAAKSDAGTLAIERVNQQMGFLPAARVAADKGVYAKAKTTSSTLTLEFIEPLPANTKALALESDVPLGDPGEGCAIKAGTYPIEFARVKTGTVTVPIYESLESSGHRRRPSKRLLG